MLDRTELFNEHFTWAQGIGRSVWRTLPPSFDVEDLQQIAAIEHWKRCELYDPAKNDSYRGYAYPWILNAVRMSTRRRAFKAATGEELTGRELSPLPDPEEAAVLAEEREQVTVWEDESKLELTKRMEGLSAGDAYLVKRVVIDGEPPENLERVWGINVTRRVSSRVRRLKRASD